MCGTLDPRCSHSSRKSTERVRNNSHQPHPETPYEIRYLPAAHTVRKLSRSRNVSAVINGKETFLKEPATRPVVAALLKEPNQAGTFFLSGHNNQQPKIK